MVATIMLSGTLMLTFVPLVSTPATYLHFYIFAATWWVRHLAVNAIPMPYAWVPVPSIPAQRRMSQPHAANRRYLA